MGDGVHTEGELLARVLQQLAALGEGLGDHLALLDAFGFIITLPSQPESRSRLGRGSGGAATSHAILGKTSESTPYGTLRSRGCLCKEEGQERRAPVCPLLKSVHYQKMLAAGSAPGQGS